LATGSGALNHQAEHAGIGLAGRSGRDAHDAWVVRETRDHRQRQSLASQAWGAGPGAGWPGARGPGPATAHQDHTIRL